MKSLLFRLDIDPPRTTAQEKGVTVIRGIPRFYEKQEVKQARYYLESALAPWKPKRPLEGALSVNMVWDYPHKGRHKDKEPKTTKPDIDNMVKLMLDCMTGTFWQDDRQIVKLTIEKRWNEKGAIGVLIQEI